LSTSRRLLLSARGGTSFQPPITTTASGPYDPALTVNEAVLTQVHCHTNQSDGSYSPATVVSNYQTAGYGALILTDHDKATAQPAGIDTAIIGNEHSPTDQHIIAMNSDYLRGGTTDAQTIIDAVVADGGQAQVAHPKWLRGMTYAELAALTDYLGFEIHNAKVVTGSGQNPVTYPGFAVDLWDQVLAGSSRSRWGFAVDDLHGIDAYHTYDVGRLHVFVDANDTSGIMSRLASGNFVADVTNLGVTPGFPDRSDDGVSLSCTGATRIEAWGSAGLLAAADASSLDYAFTGFAPYVRLVAWGDYTEGFGSALGHHWQTQSGTWSVGSGVLSLASDGNAHNYILRRHREGDFTAEVSIKLDDNRTNEAALLLFNVLTSAYSYGLRIGVSSNASENNKLVLRKTSNGVSSVLASAAYTATEDVWHRIKMAYTASSGLVQAKVWAVGDPEPGAWMVEHADTSWRHGAFGLRANYTTAFDDLYIDGFKTYYQPISID
jgi:hypothetical protein